jgi:hypothetical protein
MCLYVNLLGLRLFVNDLRPRLSVKRRAPVRWSAGPYVFAGNHLHTASS